MSWAEVDAWVLRAQAFEQEPRSSSRVVFAALLPSVRFTSRPDGREVIALRPCYHVPRKWRVLRRIGAVRLRQLAAAGERWEGARAADLLVALDRWLEAGCPPRKWAKL